MHTLSVFVLICAVLAYVYTKPIEEHHPRPYKFDYGVSDHHTGDHHQQHEINDGHVVRGSYSLKEADGTTRIVEYVAGPHSGFNAIVRRIGHAQHPQHYHHHGEQELHKNAYDNAESHISHIGVTHWGYNY